MREVNVHPKSDILKKGHFYNKTLPKNEVTAKARIIQFEEDQIVIRKSEMAGIFAGVFSTVAILAFFAELIIFAQQGREDPTTLLLSLGIMLTFPFAGMLTGHLYGSRKGWTVKIELYHQGRFVHSYYPCYNDYHSSIDSAKKRANEELDEIHNEFRLEQPAIYA